METWNLAPGCISPVPSQIDSSISACNHFARIVASSCSAIETELKERDVLNPDPFTNDHSLAQRIDELGRMIHDHVTDVQRSLANGTASAGEVQDLHSTLPLNDRRLEGLAARLALDEEHLARSMAQISENISGIATTLDAQSKHFARFEELLRQRDAHIQELKNELLLRDSKLESLATENAASGRRAQQLSQQLERREGDFADVERNLENQCAHSHRLEQQLTDARQRSRTLAEAYEALAQLADYEQRRGVHAEQLYEASKATGDLAVERLEGLSRDFRELGAHHREVLQRLEGIEGGSFWRFTRPLRAVWQYIEKHILRRNLSFRMIPNSQLEVLARDHCWRASGDDPNFELVPVERHYPHGWAVIGTSLRSPIDCGVAKLYLDYGQGFSESSVVRVFASRQGPVRHVAHFPRGLKALRWDPIDVPGEFVQGPISISEVSALEGRLRMLFRVLSVLRNYPEDVLRSYNLTYRRVLRELPRAYLGASDVLGTSRLLGRTSGT